MISAWLLRAARNLIYIALDGLSLAIPDGLEDTIFANLRIAAKAVALMADQFVTDTVLAFLLAVVSMAIVIGLFIFGERVLRRIASLLTGNDYGAAPSSTVSQREIYIAQETRGRRREFAERMKG